MVYSRLPYIYTYTAVLLWCSEALRHFLHSLGRNQTSINILYSYSHRYICDHIYPYNECPLRYIYTCMVPGPNQTLMIIEWLSCSNKSKDEAWLTPKERVIRAWVRFLRSGSRGMGWRSGPLLTLADIILGAVPTSKEVGLQLFTTDIGPKHKKIIGGTI